MLPMNEALTYQIELRRENAVILATCSKFILPDFDREKQCLVCESKSFINYLLYCSSPSPTRVFPSTEKSSLGVSFSKSYRISLIFCAQLGFNTVRQKSF